MLELRFKKKLSPTKVIRIVAVVIVLSSVATYVWVVCIVGLDMAQTFRWNEFAFVYTDAVLNNSTGIATTNTSNPTTTRTSANSTGNACSTTTTMISDRGETRPFPNANHAICRTLPHTIDQWWYDNREMIIHATAAAASQLHEPHQHAPLVAWLHSLMDFYTPTRLRRSSVVPAMAPAVQRLLEILNDYPDTHVPLRVWVMGGSVTVGRGCSSNPVGLPAQILKKDDPNCAWPRPWETFLNHVLFNQTPMVQVINKAVSATSTDVSTSMIRNRIFPPDYKPPDIVINAHGANDLFSVLSPDGRLEMLQDFVQAVHDMRSCDPHLPLVLLLDDLRGGNGVLGPMHHSALLYEVATWWDVWHVNYANTVRRHVLGDAGNPDYIHPLTSRHWESHLGLAFHIGMAWTLLYNTVHTFLQTCHSIASQTQYESHKVWTGPVSNNDTNDAWLSKAQEPLSRQSNYATLGDHWRSRLDTFSTDCQTRMGNSSTHSVCEYAWMYMHMLHIKTVEDMVHATAPHLVASENWTVTAAPEPGLYAAGTGASLVLIYRNITQPARAFTLLHIKSFYENYDNSKVEINTEIQSVNGTVRAGVPVSVSGYHGMKTTVYYTLKVMLANGGAQPGDSVQISFRLVEGSRFRIAGIALCSL
jgi:hypothetical protein